MVSVDDRIAPVRGSRMVCSTSDVEPAVPISKWNLPPEISPGSNINSVEPICASPVLAPHILDAAATAWRCCARKPGFLRLALILEILNSWPVIIDKVSELRRTCPPPSPMEPSISIIVVQLFRRRDLEYAEINTFKNYSLNPNYLCALCVSAVQIIFNTIQVADP